MSAARRTIGALLAFVMVLAAASTALGAPTRSARERGAPVASTPSATDSSDLEIVKVTPLDEWQTISGGSIQETSKLTEHFDNLGAWIKSPAADNEWELTALHTVSSPSSVGVIDAALNHDDSIEYASALNLSTLSYYQLRFWRWVDQADVGWDYMFVEAKVGAAGSWEQVGPSYSMADPAWRYETIDLTEYAGESQVYVRFSFYSDFVVPGGDAFVDDVSLVQLDRVQRVSGSSRYSTAVQIARMGFDTDRNPKNGTQWGGIEDVVIASGEDRAAADPLTAAGLCRRYQAPLFLVSSTSVPADVEAAVKQIADQTGDPVHVHMVGGTSSMPDARFTELNTAVGGGLIKDRILATGSRYDLAAAIAIRTAESYGGHPPVVLIANGADSTKFFDAMALSAITAYRGYPILLVKADDVPSATTVALVSLDPPTKIIGGGPNTVSEAVRIELGASRWSGSTRYSTATRIAQNAVSSMWLDDEVCGVAAKLPDALTGGSMIGHLGGALVLTDGSALSEATGTWLGDHQLSVYRCFVFGGTNSVDADVIDDIENALH